MFEWGYAGLSPSKLPDICDLRSWSDSYSCRALSENGRSKVANFGIKNPKILKSDECKMERISINLLNLTNINYTKICCTVAIKLIWKKKTSVHKRRWWMFWFRVWRASVLKHGPNKLFRKNAESIASSKWHLCFPQRLQRQPQTKLCVRASRPFYVKFKISMLERFCDINITRLLIHSSSSPK